MTKVAVIILNWNGKKFLEQFLPSVTKFSKSENFSSSVIVVDNASTDDSINFLQNNYHEIEIIKFDTNYGYAGGYNKAIDLIDAEYSVLLNSDVEVTPNWLEPLVQRLDNDKSIACCMPKVHAIHARDEFEYAGAAGGFIDKYGFPFCRGRIFNIMEKDNGQYDNEIDVFWATGASLFIRTDIYKKIGGLDKDFFAHMEEIDLCWRIKNAGYRIVCIPNSVIYHVGGGALPKENPFKTYLNFRNNLYLLFKNLDQKNFKRTMTQRMILDGIASMKFLLGLDFGNFRAVCKAHVSFYKNLNTLRLKRKYNLKNYTPITHKEMYNGSIVINFFLKNRRFYHLLK